MKAVVSSLLLALPERAGKMARQLNVQWLGVAALVGAMALGATAASWYWRQPKPEDIELIKERLETVLDRQDLMVEDVLYLRRSVCRLQGTPADRCERRIREDLREYRHESRAAVRDATDLRGPT